LVLQKLGGNVGNRLCGKVLRRHSRSKQAVACRIDRVGRKAAGPGIAQNSTVI